ncbi:MAG: helix-turn-helix domain-containing protein, partial [Rhodospirillales bacterium]|nr:helix-turn-helix domain-containing protein [Rhodospirillales bacterium]
MEKIAYTASEVRALLGVSLAGVSLAAQTGDLPSFKIGRRVLFPKAGLDKIVAEASGRNGRSPSAAPKAASPSPPSPSAISAS